MDWFDEESEPFESSEEPSGGPGFIYVLHCPAMPTLAKVGRTNRSPWERAAELSNHSGVPEPYDLTRAFPVFASAEAERLCHQHLDRYRNSKSREFFRDSWIVDPSGRRSSNIAVLVEVILEGAKLLDCRMAFHDEETRWVVEDHGRLREADIGVLSDRVRELEAEAADRVREHASECGRLRQLLAEAEKDIARLRSSVRQGDHLISILRGRMVAAGLTPV